LVQRSDNLVASSKPGFGWTDLARGRSVRRVTQYVDDSNGSRKGQCERQDAGAAFSGISQQDTKADKQNQTYSPNGLQVPDCLDRDGLHESSPGKGNADRCIIKEKI
jgi:hypothetical protein